MVKLNGLKKIFFAWYELFSGVHVPLDVCSLGTIRTINWLYFLKKNETIRKKDT